jgi:alpha-beta hydrolase superfamily lysophospholipase
MGVLQLDATGVSRDPLEVQQYLDDPLVYGGKLSARKVSQLFAAMHWIQEQAREIQLPLLLLHGSEDKLTAPSGSRFLYDSVQSSDKTLKIYPGLYHEIFNEPERGEVFADIESWLDSRIERRQEDGALVESQSSVEGQEAVEPLEPVRQ